MVSNYSYVTIPHRSCHPLGVCVSACVYLWLLCQRCGILLVLILVQALKNVVQDLQIQQKPFASIRMNHELVSATNKIFCKALCSHKATLIAFAISWTWL